MSETTVICASFEFLVFLLSPSCPSSEITFITDFLLIFVSQDPNLLNEWVTTSTASEGGAPPAAIEERSSNQV
eukprot:CAMPEP_0198369280 /NCGR_PEP_ID=MMETSP1450-20131203/156128_1 /TAXON_ID=753684 ORGANISM="Madagascaria erythrocladiodes, Strain CCMP3234" /NCGR_SAMPLE_ID=MMETSP1450 /ASSEMBLY_ACC=CAM_ASM_001115 /LENGTH=72 /DNA_ID=CAMNT_0044076799 /DNA_START=1063 /DNA_END=1281 /DNA_ORIENTATION=+